MHMCLDLKSSDRLLIITDRATSSIARALEQTATATQNVLVLNMEDFGERPMTSFPDAMKAPIYTFGPTAAIYAAGVQEGEIGFRKPLISYLVEELKVRHAHAPKITEEMMEGAMRGNAQELFEFTTRVYEAVKNARAITITSENGTSLTATFDPNLAWINSHPLIREQGKWGNLPNGEVFTCPDKIDGVVVVDGVLGDYLSPKFGVLGPGRAVRIAIEDSRIVSIEGKDSEVVDAFKAYIEAGDENSKRVGEFAIGTNLEITKLIGNMLSDEKSPGFHMAFGDCYGNETGASWSSKTHIDVIPLGVTIVVDGRPIMENGVFVPELLRKA
ncbi:MAG: aminopeptidase [Candidatus Burarchaeum sp.]|nr:aminopeptidase [Candidatus Burarchaeum sp.]